MRVSKPVLDAVENGYPLFWAVRKGTIYSYHLYAETYTNEYGRTRTRQIEMYVSDARALAVNSWLLANNHIRPECDLQTAMQSYLRRRATDER